MRMKEVKNGDDTKMTKYDWTRVDNDSNGNPRYVVHFIQVIPETMTDDGSINAISQRFERVVKLMNKIGGKRFSNKQYGGGIVFQSYSLPETEEAIDRIIREYDRGHSKKEND